MTTTSDAPSGDTEKQHWLFAAAGLCLGLSVPALVLGKAGMAPFFGLALIFATIAAVRSGGTFRRIRKPNSGLTISILVFLVSLLVSALLSLNVGESLSIVARVTAAIAVGSICIQLMSLSEVALRNACRALVVASFLALILAVVGVYFEALINSIRDVLGLSTPFQGPSTFKMFASASICLLPIVVWAGFRLGGNWRLLSVLTLPLTGVVIYGGGIETSFSAIFGVIGGGLLTLLVWVGLHACSLLRRAIIVAVLSSFAVIALYIFTHLPTPPVAADQVPGLPVPDWHRQVIWGFALHVFLENPVFGVGPNTIVMVPGASVIIPGMNQEYIPGHPHNSVLEIASETGLFGILSLIGLVICLLRHLFRYAVHGITSYRDAPVGRDLFHAAMAAIFLTGAFWTSSLSNFSIWSAWWLSTYVILIGLPLAACIAAEREGRQG